MIAVDASVIISWLADGDDPKVKRLDATLDDNEAFVAPVTVTELLSDPKGGLPLGDRLLVFRMFDLQPGYWERAGLMRAALRRAGLKAPMADALIAQACIDANIPLLTREEDFQVYADLFGLKLA